MTSDDGNNWVYRSVPDAGADAARDEWESVTYGNNRFVAVSSRGTNRVMTSDDGIGWVYQSVPDVNTEPDLWNSVTYGNNRFVAVS